jgi:hypothetical protein
MSVGGAKNKRAAEVWRPKERGFAAYASHGI